MPPPGGTRTTIEQSVIDRVSGAVSGAIKGAKEAWFGPLEPIAPAAPPDTAGRAFDYPFGFNRTYAPRGEVGQGGIDMATLQALADPVNGGLDLIRGAIETRKDLMSTQAWKVKGRDGSDGGTKARKVEELLWQPDGVEDYYTWQRKALEDLLVIDALTLYLKPDKGGLFKPEILDGATIKRLIRPDGRMPLAPEPAYVQRLKGMPAVHYSAAELIYRPRNARPSKLYGMSPVEQMVVTVNIALRRQMSQLEAYTAGSVPDLLLATPPGWSPKQIGEFQQYWDALLSGNTEERRRARFIPDGVKPYELKAGQLKDEMDEWLARLVCWFFSLSPQALLKQMNRGSAQTAKQSAQEEGMEPYKVYWKSVVDQVIRQAYLAPELEFAYQDEEIVDPTVKVTVFTGLVTAGIVTKDEAREAYGMPPLTPEQKDELAPPPPVVVAPPPQDDGSDEPPKDLPPKGSEAGAEKVATVTLCKAGRSLRGARAKLYQGHQSGSCSCQKCARQDPVQGKAVSVGRAK
jgi:hypothetical protein